MLCYVLCIFFPTGVYVGTLNLIALIPGPSFLILLCHKPYLNLIQNFVSKEPEMDLGPLLKVIN